MKRFIGIDLSGPGSAQHTSVAVFQEKGRRLELEMLVAGADDAEILSLVPDSSIVGLDAPLSYSPTGKSRASDAALRSVIAQTGLSPGSVIAPSAPRMVYLTLRGVMVCSLLSRERTALKIVEVHPTAAMALRGAPIQWVRSMKKDPEARASLMEWLEKMGLCGVRAQPEQSDHSVAACAAALATWKWYRREPVWLHKAEPPFHPYDFAC